MTDPTVSANGVDLERAQSLYQAGRARMDSGAFEEAIQAFSESIAIDPHFKALELMGECLLALGKPIQAVVPLGGGLGAQRSGPRAIAARSGVSLHRRLSAGRQVRQCGPRACSRKPGGTGCCSESVRAAGRWRTMRPSDRGSGMIDRCKWTMRVRAPRVWFLFGRLALVDDRLGGGDSAR